MLTAAASPIRRCPTSPQANSSAGRTSRAVPTTAATTTVRRVLLLNIEELFPISGARRLASGRGSHSLPAFCQQWRQDDGRRDSQRLCELRDDVRRREGAGVSADARRRPARANRDPGAAQHDTEDCEIQDQRDSAVFGEDVLQGLSHVGVYRWGGGMYETTPSPPQWTARRAGRALRRGKRLGQPGTLDVVFPENRLNPPAPTGEDQLDE